MKQFILENEEKERIKKLYELKGIIINESIGELIRQLLKWASKNEDDIAMLFKSSERAAAASIDDIVSNAMKTKNLSELETLQMRLMHAFNPSGLAENIPQAQQKVKNVLNGYAKSRGQQNWNDIKNSVVSGPKPNAGQSAGSSGSPKPNTGQQSGSYSGGIQNWFLGKRVSNRSFIDNPNILDFTQMSTIKNIDQFNTAMAKALKTGDFNLIPRGGFEKLGIKPTDYNGYGFRGFIRDQFLNKGAKVNEVIPETGRWSVTFVN